MRKIFCLLLISILLRVSLEAQDSTQLNIQSVDSPVYKRQFLYLRVGGSLLLPFNSQSNPVIFPALTIAPGIRILEAKDFILSLSFPISLLGTFKTDLLLGMDLPIMLDFNLGAASANDKKSTVGFIVGAGFAYIDAVNNYDNQEGYLKRADFWGYRMQFGIDICKDNSQNGQDIFFLTYGRSVANRNCWMIGVSVQIMLSGH